MAADSVRLPMLHFPHRARERDALQVEEIIVTAHQTGSMTSYSFLYWPRPEEVGNGREQDIHGAGHKGDAPEEEENGADDHHVIHATDFLHPLGLAEHVADCFALDHQKEASDDAE